MAPARKLMAAAIRETCSTHAQQCVLVAERGKLGVLRRDAQERMLVLVESGRRGRSRPGIVHHGLCCLHGCVALLRGVAFESWVLRCGTCGMNAWFWSQSFHFLAAS